MSAPTLEAVLGVQEVDTDLDQHRHRRAVLPEKLAAAELGRRVVVLDAERADAEVPVGDLSRRQDALEADLAAAEARIVAVNKRLYGGEVSASRDLQAMTAEVKALEARRSDLEDRILELMDEREPHDQRLADLGAARMAARGEGELLATRIATLEQAIDAEIAELAERRMALAARVPADLLTLYEKLRVRGGGVGAARLIGSICGGCHLVLPSGDLDRLRHLPADAVAFCEECGRILVRS